MLLGVAKIDLCLLNKASGFLRAKEKNVSIASLLELTASPVSLPGGNNLNTEETQGKPATVGPSL